MTTERWVKPSMRTLRERFEEFVRAGPDWDLTRKPSMIDDRFLGLYRCDYAHGAWRAWLHLNGFDHHVSYEPRDRG